MLLFTRDIPAANVLLERYHSRVDISAECVEPHRRHYQERESKSPTPIPILFPDGMTWLSFASLAAFRPWARCTKAYLNPEMEDARVSTTLYSGSRECIPGDLMRGQ